MNARELRQRYIAFFKSKGHDEHPSGSLVPVDVTGRPDESLLFTGAGMVQFKPYFLGTASPPSKRLCNVQKCMRTGDIDEVGNLNHLTFFEMLGNFSFGDYYKKDAIAYSWEFMTSPEWLGLDPARLCFTVFETDDESYDLWAAHLKKAGLDPSRRIFRLGEDKNYWPAGAFSSGPPGPCGPNTEMFYWVPQDEPPPSGPYAVSEYLRDDEAGKWLEIWNDVFIASDWQGKLRDPSRPDKGYEKSAMPDLPFQSVDTGMGLERTACVLGGFSSVYETDAFTPIIAAIESCRSVILSGSNDEGSSSSVILSGSKEHGAAGTLRYGNDPEKDIAIRIIADHLRTASFCIADGVLPSNTGRGYVLRRLIRRAVLKGVRALGFEEPFLHRCYDGVVSALGDHYVELLDRKAVVVETLKNEEEQFRRTLEQGTQILLRELQSSGGKQLSGASAFKLYDTYGFPFEVTREIALEHSFKVDYEGYLEEMKAAQERSRSGSGMDTVYGGVEMDEPLTDQPTEFVGYRTCGAGGAILAVREISEDRLAIAFDMTPFYAKSGGQVSDIGQIHVNDEFLDVLDVTRDDSVIVHITSSHSAPQELVGATAQLYVNHDRRAAITRNHTATHLMHAALRNVLGDHVTQAGSLVDDKHLRFDFTHGKAMTTDEIAQVEHIVNDEVLKAQSVKTYDDVALQEAREMGAMALFGEKYADRVRVVQIGDMPSAEKSFSRELCGGIHVSNTGEIGLFKIVGESSAASGVRRVEAVTGHGAIEWANQQRETVEKAAKLLKSQPAELLTSVEKTLQALKEEKLKRQRLAQQGAGSQEQVEQIGSVQLAVEKLEEADPQDAQLVADRLTDGKPDRVALVVLVSGGKLSFVCKVGDAAKSAGAHAGNLLREVAKVAGGGGGGRADFATAGGKDASKIDEAIARGREVLAEQVK